MKITQAVLCAAAIALAADAKVSLKQEDMGEENMDDAEMEEHYEDEHHYDDYEDKKDKWVDFRPEGGEWIELMFGLQLGYFKNMWKYERDYDCKSLMFAWGYRMYNFYNIYNGKYDLKDDWAKVGTWGVFWSYEGYKAFDACLDERDIANGEVDVEAGDDDGRKWGKGILSVISALLSLNALPDYRKKENYMAFGTALTNAMSAGAIGAQYLLDEDWF